jgi:hypothetical protein
VRGVVYEERRKEARRNGKRKRAVLSGAVGVNQAEGEHEELGEGCGYHQSGRPARRRCVPRDLEPAPQVLDDLARPAPECQAHVA